MAALLISLSSFAQLPNPNDTVPGGRKVSFSPFMGRFSVFTEAMGAAMMPGSMNLGFTVFKSESVLIDLTAGLTLHDMPGFQFQEGYSIPATLSLHLGRRRSRLNVKLGYFVSWTPGFESSPWPQCGGICPTPPQHRGIFSLGYVLQQASGFFFGVNAYGFVHLIPQERRYGAPMYKEDIYPWAGMTFGYRIPSQLQLLTWKERRAGKVLISRDRKEKTKVVREKQITDLDEAIIAAKLEKMEGRKERLVLREERMALRELRDNGPHNVFLEAFGAGHTWSVNYQHARPVKEGSIVHAFGRVGIGGFSDRFRDSRSLVGMPLAGGIQLMRNYRGGGIGLGATPTFTRSGEFTVVSFVSLEFHFHVAHGITFGTGYQVMFDPQFAHGNKQVFQWGGFSVGYRFKRKRS